MKLLIEVDNKVVGFIPIIPCEPESQSSKFEETMALVKTACQLMPKNDETTTPPAPIEPEKPAKTRRTGKKLVEEGKALIVKDNTDLEANIIALLKEKGGMPFPAIQKELGTPSKELYPMLMEMKNVKKTLKFEMQVFQLAGGI